MKTLANDNSDLREQLDKVRGQLVETRRAAKSGPGTDDVSSKVGEGEIAKKGAEREQSGKGGSCDGEKVDVYRAQIKDLQKRIAQLQEVTELSIRQN